MGFALNNKTDAVALIKALKQSGNEQQLALARLLSTLSVRGYSQKKVMEAGDIGLNRLARLLKSAPGLFGSQELVSYELSRLC